MKRKYPMTTRSSRTYFCWIDMRRRCYSKTRKAFTSYGARGITVCDRWRNSFSAFLQDMGEKPVGKTLDRYPDKNGNYEPGNCRWATPAEQGANMRSNRLLTLNDETMILSQWARRIGISPGGLWNRIELRGWSLEKTLTTTRHR